jgi:hypothetical protein
MRAEDGCLSLPRRKKEKAAFFGKTGGKNLTKTDFFRNLKKSVDRVRPSVV